jgi:hypothetical protein
VAGVRGPGDAAGVAATARRLATETAGNPFMLTEMLRVGTDAAGGGAIPAGVADLVGTRLARLDRTTTAFLQAAAVAGARFDLDVAADAAGLDDDALLDAVDAALASGLIVEDGAERGRFPHDIVRRTLVAGLSAARRRALHQRLAAAIERLRAGGLDAHVAMLAHHSAAGAGPAGDVGAVAWSRRASAHATAHNAPAEAVRLWRQALALVPADEGGLAAEVTTGLGIALVTAGDGSGVRTLLDGAALARRHDRPDVLGRAALALADAADERPDLEAEARRLVDAAVRAAAPDPGGGEGALRHARLLVRQLRLGGVVDLPPPAALAALRERLAGLAAPGDVDERLRIAGELAVLADRAGDVASRVVAARETAMAAATLGDEDGVVDAMAVMAALAGDDPGAAAAVAEWAAVLHVARGAFPEAVAAAGALPAAGAGLPHPELLAWLWADAPPPPDGAGAAGVLGLLVAGDGDGARARLRDVLEDTRDRPEDGATLLTLGLAALAARALGDPDVVAEVQARLAPHADLMCGDGYRTVAGAASFHLGRLAAAAGEWAEAERHLLTALRVHTAWRARPWVALTQLALADVTEARGRPTDREWIAGLRTEAAWATTTLGLRPGA